MLPAKSTSCSVVRLRGSWQARAAHGGGRAEGRGYRKVRNTGLKAFLPGRMRDVVQQARLTGVGTVP